MPESFFVLSKEHLELAIDEIAAIAKMYDASSEIRVMKNAVMVQSKTNWQKIAKRASFVRTAGEVIEGGLGVLGGAMSEELKGMIEDSGTFCCRVLSLTRSRGDIEGIEMFVGGLISGATGATVDLENPGVTIYILLAGEHSVTGFSKEKLDTIEPKKPRTHPNELDRRLARAMLNLAGIRENETVCDPFCGTGTTCWRQNPWE